MARDKGCRWHFDNETGSEDGPNDSMVQHFKKSPYMALIRESIQNSLDAVLDRSQPVNVTIEPKTLKAIEFPSFFDLREHVEGCLSYFSQNSNAKEVFEPMLPYLNCTSGEDTISYIKISDTNTKGMAYEPGNTNCPFYAFVRSKGVSSKENQTSGGSFGFGKAAYFNMSPVRSVFVSTMLPGGQQIFEGIASLCTHKYEGEKKTSVGYYDNNDGNPILNADNIPTPFKRTEPGTSICIMGINPAKKQGAFDEMIDAVLRNFWMAIWMGRLTVSFKVENIDINKENLESLMKLRFEEDVDKSTWSDLHNPRPYFEAVLNAGEEDSNCLHITDSLPDLGQIDLYIKLNPNVTDKIVYMRKPLMTVYCRKTKTNYGFNGVIVCNGEEVNKHLRDIENPTHDEWDAKNGRNNEIKKVGKKTLEDLQTYISKTLEKIFCDDSGGSLNITDLEEYLYVPEDLTAESFTKPQSQLDMNMGRLTGDYKDDGGSVTTDIQQEEPDMSPTQSSQTGHVIVSQVGNVKPKSNGPKTVGIGNKHTGSNRKINNPAAGHQFDGREVLETEDGSFLEYIPVTFRVVAEMEEGMMYHSIIFHSPLATSKGEIELIIGGEQTDEVPEIAEVLTHPSGICENFITDLRVLEGKNVVKLRFNDNMKHAIILKAYERK